MYAIIPESLVLRGKAVAGGVAAGRMQLGTVLDRAETSAFLSNPRHPSGCPQAGPVPATQRLQAAKAKRGAVRAGRPGGVAGVLERRGPAGGFVGWSSLSSGCLSFHEARHAGGGATLRTGRRRFRCEERVV